MKNLIKKSLLVFALLIPSILSADQLKGLNVIITSADAQTQMMGMVLSTMALKKHKKIVNITLCGPAGDLAVKGMESPIVKRPRGAKDITPKMALTALLKAGVSVEICQLYLPNTGKDASVLLDGISVAKPPMVAAKLLDSDFNNVSF